MRFARMDIGSNRLKENVQFARGVVRHGYATGHINHFVDANNMVIGMKKAAPDYQSGTALTRSDMRPQSKHNHTSTA